MPLSPTYRGSVNKWECDENDHLNVRHYFGKANEGLPFVMAELGWTRSALESRGARVFVRSQHMRFLKEARGSTPLTVYSGVAAWDETRFRVYNEIRHGSGGEVMAAVLSVVEVVGSDGRPVPVEPPPERVRCAIPDHGAPKGLPADGHRTYPEYARLAELGFVEISRGVVRASHCDAYGELEPHEYVGRIVDGVPNLFLHFLSDEERRPRAEGVQEGRAALEFRIVRHGTLRVGDRFTVSSGVCSVGHKAYQIAHFMYGAETGQCVAACGAIGVAFDLLKRRVIEVPEARRRLMESLLVPGGW